MSTLKVTNIQATGETASRAVSGVAAAWVNFNGTGTAATRDSVNVSSLTDNGTGYFNMNWSSAFSATDYAMTSNAQNGNATDYNRQSSSIPYSTSYASINTWATSNTTLYDVEHTQAKAHGDLA